MSLPDLEGGKGIEKIILRAGPKIESKALRSRISTTQLWEKDNNCIISVSVCI
jgi:hypothetical protein